MHKDVRFDIIERYGLKPHKTTNLKEVIYTYFTPDKKMFVHLEHFSRKFYFSIISDTRETLESQHFQDFSDLDKFEAKYNEFRKFFNLV